MSKASVQNTYCVFGRERSARGAETKHCYPIVLALSCLGCQTGFTHRELSTLSCGNGNTRQP